MLAARPCETDRNPWFLSKYNPPPPTQKVPSPRMSDNCTTSLATQSDWKANYTYPSQNDVVNFNHPFERGHDLSVPRHSTSSTVEDRGNHLGLSTEHGRSPLLQQPTRSLSDVLHPERSSEQARRQSTQAIPRDFLAGKLKVEAVGDTSSEATIDHPVQAPKAPGSGPENHGQDGRLVVPKEEEDETMEDDEILDGEVEHCPPGSTVAERAAARRKMKRFRLTHQQTRFLMSEFVKQPHPDAGHRERLSSEIPGLSPRQVQVWFQNRRAKIKRLNAEDRDRMIKMRAVPENFDNVQALHSPYGAVHGISAALSSSSDLGNQPYGDQLMRPLMIDVRRTDPTSNLSPTGLTPSFGTVGFNSAGAGNSEIMSPLSSASNDRYTYGSHVSSPLSTSTRSANPFAGRQGSLDSAMHLNRQGIDSLQPLRLGDHMSRPRTDSMQSPLRSAVSWKGDTLDYSNYQGSSASISQNLQDRQQPMYQLGSASTSNLGTYDTDNYSNHAVQSPTTIDSSSTQTGLQGRSRLRASSATFPLSLDMRNQYRPTGASSQSVNYAQGNRTATPLSQYSSPSLYTTSYPAAPLTAPITGSPMKPSTGRSSATDFTRPQMSPPISAPPDFQRSTHTSAIEQGAAARSPLKEAFGVAGAVGYNHGQERSETFGGDLANAAPSITRKASFPFPSGSGGDRSTSGSHIFDHLA